mgnify:FL=1
MTGVRIHSAPHNGMEQYIGCYGEIIGVTGQFVKVRITHDPHGNVSAPTDRYHFFTPRELEDRDP